ncbi:MAG: MerC domain-containing protein [Planctomycetota bacterium]
MSTATLARPTPNFRSWADWAGMTASIGCAIHCAAMPLVIAYLPALGLEWIAREGFHQYMALICMVLALAAFVPGWRIHRSVVPLAWGATGLILLNVVAFGLEESCCPKCDVASTALVTTGEQRLASAVIAGDCTAGSCSDAPPTCVEGEGALVIAQPATTELQTLAGMTVPLMTPLGGLLLVCGHIVNHRKRCRCQGGKCCVELGDATEPEEVTLNI